VDEAAAEDPSVAGVSIDGSERVNTVTGTWADLVPEPQDVDLYSVSMYTGDLLGSRMSLDILRQTQAVFTPPIRNAPSRPHPQLSQVDLDDSRSMEIEEWPRISVEHRDASITTSDPERVSRIGSGGHQHQRDYTSPNYLKIELVFHALDTWKQGVVSKVKNESKSLWEGEKRRLHDLHHTYRQKTWSSALSTNLGVSWKRSGKGRRRG
jgi:hypothetical protein